MLNEKSQFQKITCCMILFITILKRQHDTNREQISCYQGLARGWDRKVGVAKEGLDERCLQ